MGNELLVAESNSGPRKFGQFCCSPEVFGMPPVERGVGGLFCCPLQLQRIKKTRKPVAPEHLHPDLASTIFRVMDMYASSVWEYFNQAVIGSVVVDVKSPVQA